MLPSSWPSRVTSEPVGRLADIASPEQLHLVVTGHVDHGKSTIVGRLLADTGSVAEEKLETVRSTCRRHARPFEYAFLLDALKDEQAQGITIDSARVFFKTARRHYAIIDAPGHLEFLKNMISGASRAEAALLVIDAQDGVCENSRRHAFMLSMLGMRQIVVLINKMDLVGYRAEVFDRVSREIQDFLGRIGVTPSSVIPVSGFAGDNLVAPSANLRWYNGPTLLAALDGFISHPRPAAAPFRMPVQGVYKFTANDDTRRIVAGTVESGRLMEGDEVVFYPSGKRSRVRRLEGFSQAARAEASAGEAIGITLTDQIYLRRGEIATRAGQPKPHVGTRLKVSLFWLGKSPLTAGHRYALKLGTARVPCLLDQVHRVIDASDLSTADGLRTCVDRHEVAECTLVLEQPLAFDTTDQCPSTRRFVVVDEYEISGGGIIRDVLTDATRSSRAQIEPAVVWFTGLSGAGKSTIAGAVYRRLMDEGVRVEYLDGDSIRSFFPATGFSRAEREDHVKRVGFLASRLEHHGVVVICALISPHAQAREAVRRLCGEFVEVYVSTPLQECERRDVKGLYARARRGELPNFTGVDDPYEPPSSPDLRIDTTVMSVAEAADLVTAMLDRNRVLSEDNRAS